MMLLRRCLFGIVLVSAAAAGADEELPRRHYQLKESYRTPQLCVEALPDHKLRLTYQGETQRDPFVVDGSYQILEAQKEAQKRRYKVRFDVSEIHHKTLSKCRKYWIDESLESVKVFETPVRRGAPLTLTLDFRCVDARASVELCFLDSGADGHQAICRQLFDWDRPAC